MPTKYTINEDMRRQGHKGIQGQLTITQVVEDASGARLLSELGPDDPVRKVLAQRAEDAGMILCDKIVKNNLVVNSGRSNMCLSLGGDVRKFVNRVQLGDAKIGGVVVKDTYPPDLSDTGLIHEIRTLLGAPGATFNLDSATNPSIVTKSSPAGLPGTLTAGVTSVLSDSGADFLADGVTDEDQATVFIGGETFTLGVRQVISSTQLEVENPSQVAGAGVAYTVQTPAGQVLFRKLVSGENFPESLYGPLTIAHEAGLLFNDSALFNRVIFAAGNPAVGLLLQPRDVDGVILSAQLDWLITI